MSVAAFGKFAPAQPQWSHPRRKKPSHRQSHLSDSTVRGAPGREQKTCRAYAACVPSLPTAEGAIETVRSQPGSRDQHRAGRGVDESVSTGREGAAASGTSFALRAEADSPADLSVPLREAGTETVSVCQWDPHASHGAHLGTARCPSTGGQIGAGPRSGCPPAGHRLHLGQGSRCRPGSQRPVSTCSRNGTHARE